MEDNEKTKWKVILVFGMILVLALSSLWVLFVKQSGQQGLNSCINDKQLVYVFWTGSQLNEQQSKLAGKFATVNCTKDIETNMECEKLYYQNGINKEFPVWLSLVNQAYALGSQTQSQLESRFCNQ